jgi:hypothetical protein
MPARASVEGSGTAVMLIAALSEKKSPEDQFAPESEEYRDLGLVVAQPLEFWAAKSLSPAFAVQMKPPPTSGVETTTQYEEPDVSCWSKLNV